MTPVTTTTTWTREALAAAGEDALPRSLGRMRWRKAESSEDWRARILGAIDRGDLVLREPTSRTRELDFDLDALQAFAQLAPDQSLEVMREPAPRLSVRWSNATAEKQREVEPFFRDGLHDLRGAMYTWVLSTFPLKVEEAIFCDLHCLRCPSGQLLQCAIDNRETRRDDGVPAVLELP